MSGIPAANLAAAQSLGADPATTELIAAGLGLIHVLQVYTSSMVTLAVWDWLVCLKMEWHRIWKREWSLVKVLYLWTRYYGLICFAVNLSLFTGNYTNSQCEKLHYIIAASCMWVTLGSEMILAVRTYAFLGKKLSIAIFLSVMLLGETAFLLYVSIAAVHRTPLLIGDKGPCTASDAPGKHVVSGFWMAPVLFDLICTIMTLYKAFTLKSKSQLVRVFLKEGLLYFLAVAFINILNAVFMFQPNANIQNINCFLALVLSQVLCCRLVLNLRSSDNRDTTNYSTPSGTAHAFSPPASRPTQSGGINIPLNKFGPYSDDGTYSGVKVQVDVERDGETMSNTKV